MPLVVKWRIIVEDPGLTPVSTETAFKPAWWLPSPHLQTLWPVMFRRRITPELRHQRYELEDGDFIDLCWSKKAGQPVVLLLHGLEGSLQSHYAGNLMVVLEQAGFRPVLMHFRGCSGEPNRLPRSYHSGDTGDLAAVVEYINSLPGCCVHAAIPCNQPSRFQYHSGWPMPPGDWSRVFLICTKCTC